MQSIHIQSFVAASPREVWKVLLGRPEVVLDALPARAWPEPRQELAPSRLGVRWPFTESAGGATQIEIRLHEVEGGTRIDLRHSGWGETPAWQEPLSGHFAGWLQALAALGLLVETGKDARPSPAGPTNGERYFCSGEIPASADAVYRTLTEPGVLERWSEGVLDAAELTDHLESRFLRWMLRKGGRSSELVVILRRTPRGTHCALAEYGVADRSPSLTWPPMLERLAQFLI